MSRLRKIYKGEETWDVIYDDQDQILSTQGKKVFTNNLDNNSNNAIPTPNPNFNKTFKEDNNPNSNTKKTGITFNFNNKPLENILPLNLPVNRISHKLLNVTINSNENKNLINIDNDNRDETDVQELVFNDNENEDINDRDYDNFDHIYENQNENIRQENKSVSMSISSMNHSLKYNFEKRNYGQAFGEKDSINGESLHHEKSVKKMKLD